MKNNRAGKEVRRSLRFESVLMALAMLLPVLALVAWEIFGHQQRKLDDSLAVAGRLARFTATDAERFLDIARTLLEFAARHPAVASPGGRDCDPAFQGFAAFGPAYSGYVATDLQGRIACSGDLPGLKRLPAGAHAWVPPLAAADRFWVGAAMPEAANGWVVPVAVPLRSGGDTSKGFVSIRLGVSQLRLLVASARLPEGTDAGIMDWDGRLLAHTSEALALGPHLGAELARATLGSAEEGTFEARGDGGTRLYGFARVADTDWIAFASLPGASLQDASRAAWARIGLVTLLALALGTAFAASYGRRIVGPALAVAKAAGRVAGGLRDSRLPVAGPAELAFISQQFNRLLDALQEDDRRVHDAEKRIRDLFTLSADWYWETDTEHRFVAVEGIAFEQHADLYKDVIGKRRWEFPGYAPLEGSWDDYRARVDRHEAFYDVAFRQTTPSGEVRYLRVSGLPAFDGNGAFAGYHGVAADISLEARYRLSLEASERRYRAVFGNNRLSNILLDPANGRIIDASEGACALFGLPGPALRQMRLDEMGLAPCGNSRSVLDFLRSAASARKELQGRDRRGRVRVLEADTGRVETDGRMVLFVSFHDITARREAEDELRKLVRAVEQSPASIVITDRQGNIEYVNPRFEEVTGYGRDEVLGRNPRLFQSGLTLPAVYEALWRTITSGGEWRGELCNRRKSGELFWEQASISGIVDDAGEVTHFLAVKEDITERRRREEEILELNATLDRRVAERTAELERANRELDAFSYSVSHDLRAPLRAINGFVHLVEDSDGDRLGDEARENLGRVKRNALRMGELIDDMLEFARIGRSKLALRKVSLGGTAKEVAQELQSQNPAAEVVIAELPEAVCDPAMMRQVFANLIGNAFKYSAKKDAPRIEIGTCAVAGETACFVRDNGAGFDMQYADKLFGVFQRLHHARDFPGTGVGLAIAKRIVERHGGRIWAESVPGEGATFYFTLGTQS